MSQKPDDVLSRMDMAPTLAWLGWMAWLAWMEWMMGAETTMAKGYLRGQMSKDHVTGVPEPQSISWV